MKVFVLNAVVWTLEIRDGISNVLNVDILRKDLNISNVNGMD